MNKCNKCGNSVSEFARFCNKCGSLLVQQGDSDLSDLNFGANIGDNQSPILSKEIKLDSQIKIESNYVKKTFFQKIIDFIPILLLLINSIIIFYVIYHPGTLYRRRDIGIDYPHVVDTWIFVGIILLFNVILSIINKKNLLFITAITYSSIFIIGLFFRPKLIFHFSQTGWEHTVLTIPLIFIITILIINLLALVKYLKITYKK